MRRLIFKIILFLLLLAPVFVLPVLVLLGAGELTPASAVARAQLDESHPIVYGCAYSDSNKLLKLDSVLLRRPEVLALGSSRILGFRRQFFLPGVNYYDAGLAVRKLPQFRQFLAKIPPGHEPKVLILMLDERYFDPVDLTVPNDYEKELHDAATIWRPFNILSEQWRTVYANLSAGRFHLRDIFSPRTGPTQFVGLQARIDQLGSRNDGSQLYGALMKNLSPQPVSVRFEEGLHNIASGEERFRFGPGTVNPAALAEVSQLLAACHARHIQVVGFVPPYAPTIYRALHDGKHGYVFAIGPAIQPLFQQFGFSFTDFSDPAVFGGSDPDFLDAYHPTEKGSLRLFIALAAASPALQPYCDLPKLKRLLEQTTNAFFIFPG